VTEPELRLFESITALVVVFDVDGRIVYWNHRCSDLTGYALEEVRGRKLWDFALLPDEVDSAQKAFATAVVSGEPSSHTNHWVTRTGERRWVDASRTVTRHADGRIQYVVETAIDASDRKRAADAQRASQAMLGAHAVEIERLYEHARRVTDDLREANQHMVSATIRAQELTEKVEAALARSEESERELREIAELRERFIGIVSHDLRNPLGAIALATDVMLQRGHLDEQDRELVSRIVASAQRMTRMLLQLLDFTRVRLGGGIPLEEKPVDLRDVCRNVVDELGTAVRLEIEGDVTGTWDADRLTEALSNIARNAIEHAAEGTNVVARAHAERADVVVEVTNQGEPIPPTLLPFIFDPFRRARRERSTSGNLGLGLYIAKQIALASGGTLDARSGDGATTFVMRLPRAA
jgi:PAS domain S-box-containing protein